MSIDLSTLIISERIVEDEEEEVFDNPDGSEWIVSVDIKGNVSILSAPNIAPWFFDGRCNAEEIGIPYEVGNLPGVYKWKCSYWCSRDWESGQYDDYGFDVEEETVLYLVGGDSV